MSVRAERPLHEYLRGIAHNISLDFQFVNDFEIQAFPEPPPLSESLGSPEPPPLSETLAYSMPVAQSIFLPTTPSHPGHIGHTQSLTPQSFRTFVPSTASFVTLQVASNEVHIIPPPPQFSDSFC